MEMELTVYGIETLPCVCQDMTPKPCCSSTYRLQYAPQSVRKQRSKATMRFVHLKYLNEVKVKRR